MTWTNKHEVSFTNQPGNCRQLQTEGEQHFTSEQIAGDSLARCLFEILHLSQFAQYRKNCIFYGKWSLKLEEEPLPGLNPRHASEF